MNSNVLPKQIAAVLFAALFASAALADVVETKNGARIVGQIVKISDGAVSMNTD